MNTLFERVCWGKENLPDIEPNYAIVWLDPDDEQEVARVTVPSPRWLAMALHGWLLPSLAAMEATRYDVVVDGVSHQNVTQAGRDELHRNHGSKYSERIVDYSAVHASVIGPMTEEEAIEYLLQKDVPRHVWADYGQTNRQKFAFCTHRQVPTDRTQRNAWRLAA